jgi:hypothetical protein
MTKGGLPQLKSVTVEDQIGFPLSFGINSPYKGSEFLRPAEILDRLPLASRLSYTEMEIAYEYGQPICCASC